MSNVSNLLQKSSKHSTYVSETNGNTKDTSEWRINYFVDKIFLLFQIIGLVHPIFILFRFSSFSRQDLN